MQGDAEGVHLRRLDAVAMDYFGRLFPSAQLGWQAKKGGDQLGGRIIIRQQNMGALTYHVKTHSDGRLVSKSSAPKIVNPRELLVYKVLENLGTGCESHFLARSPEDVYIATRDAGESGSFSTFAGILTNESDLGSSAWGSLSNLKKFSTVGDLPRIEEGLLADPIGQQFIRQVVIGDAVSRLFGLHDLLTNPENFGFLKQDSGSFVLRIIDFRVSDDVLPEDERERSDILIDSFKKFLEGNGSFKYRESHKTIRFVLHDRQREKRVREMLSIFEGPLHDFERMTEDGYGYVLRFLQETKEMEGVLEDLLHDIAVYKDAINSGFRFFLESLQRWHP